MIRVALTDKVIDLNSLIGEFKNPAHGAQIIFTGAVRNHNQGKKVLGVSYDAHPTLAKVALNEIAGEALKKFESDLDVLIVHRYGRLTIGEASLVIIVSSRHRDESFLASRYLIEEIKVRVPIWKKEHYEEGDSEWLQGHALCGHEIKDPEVSP